MFNTASFPVYHQLHCTVCIPLQVEQARFLVPPFTLRQANFETDPSEVEPVQQSLPSTPDHGGTRSMLAHLRSVTTTFALSSTLHAVMGTGSRALLPLVHAWTWQQPILAKLA